MRTLCRSFLLLVLLFAPVLPVTAQESGSSQPAPQSDSPLSVDEVVPPPTVTPTLQVPTPVPQPTATPGATTQADVGASVARSVVQVLTEAGQGSGVALPGGILTAAHVVQEATKIIVTTADNRQASATVTRLDPAADLALLQTDLVVPTLDLEDLASQRQGDPVMVLGYVTNKDNSVSATLTSGQISAIGKGRNDRALLQTSALMAPGNSGGAVVNARGKLIGVPSFIVPIGSITTNVAVGSDTIYAFLALAADKVSPPPPTPLYHGEPQNVALPYAFLGTGWVQDTEDRSQVTHGAYAISWHLDPSNAGGRIRVLVGSAVLPNASGAIAIWENVAPADQSMVEIRVPAIGDAVVAWAKPNGTEVYFLGRAKNVILSVDEQRATPLTRDQVFSPGGASSMLAYMVDRVNSQAH